jgi:hypothetical protein
MQPQINRVYELIVGNAVSGEGLLINDLQCTFDISKTSNNKDKTNSASIELYNLSNDSLKLLDVDYPAAVFSAGYRDIGIKRLFAGQVTGVSTRKSGADRVTQILMGDSYTNLNHQILSSLVAPGQDGEAAFKSLQSALGVSHTVFNSVNLKSKLLYGYPMQGTPKDMLNELSERFSVDWQINDNVLYIHDNDRGNSEKFEDAYVISKYTGLIENAYRVTGDARRSKKDKAKKQGVQFKMLLNPDIVPGDIIKLEDVLFNGYFKVTDMRFSGDWRGAAWYTEVRCDAIEKVIAK